MIKKLRKNLVNNKHAYVKPESQRKRVGGSLADSTKAWDLTREPQRKDFIEWEESMPNWFFKRLNYAKLIYLLSVNRNIINL